MRFIMLVTVLFGVAAEQWDVVRPFKVSEDKKQFSPDVIIKDSSVTLRNRGTLVSKDEYPAGATIKTTWKWTKGTAEGKYHDHLLVVLFSSGKQEKWPFEVTDGLSIRFNPGAGVVSVEHLAIGKDPVVVAKAADLTFERDKEYALEITADRKNVAIKIDGKEVVAGKVPEGLAGKKIVVYNREPVAADEKESILTNLTLVAPKQ